MLEGQTFTYRVYSFQTIDLINSYEELFNCETEIECREYFQKKISEVRATNVELKETIYNYQADGIMMCKVEHLHGEEMENWEEEYEYINEVDDWNKYKPLKDLVTTFEGDIIASCSANKYVKPFKDLGNEVLFYTECGKVVSVYKSLLKPETVKQFEEL